MRGRALYVVSMLVLPVLCPVLHAEGVVIEPILTFTGHGGAVCSVAFSPDGTKALTGSTDDTAKLWNVATGACLRTFTGPAYAVYSVAFSPDGTKVLTGSNDKTAKLWDASTGSCLRTFTGHTAVVCSVAFFPPDGTKVLTGSQDATAKLWDTSTGACLRTFTGHASVVCSVAFSPDGTKVLTGSWDATAKLWDVATGACLRTFTGHAYDLESVAFAPDGTKVLTGGDDYTAKLWDAATGTCLRTFAGHTDWVMSVAFPPDGTKVLTGSGDTTAKLWDAATGACLRTFVGHTDWVYSAAFSPDGTKVLTGSEDHTAKLWLAPPPPIANDDDLSIAEDSPATALDVLNNDTYYAPEKLAIVATTCPEHGHVHIIDGGTGLTYQPDHDYYGQDTFSYTISDEFGATDTATVTITVTEVNDDPDARDDLVMVVMPSGQSVPLVIDVADLLSNDTYLPDPPETLTLLSVGPASHGTASISGDQVLYTPERTYEGTDSFSYTISDGRGGSDTALVTVRVRRLGAVFADLSGDGCVNVTDLLVVRNQMGKGSCQ